MSFIDYKDPQLFFSFIKNISSIFFIWSIVILYLYNSNQKPSLICLCSTKKFRILHVKHACLIASCSRLTFIKSMVEKYDVPRNLICFILFFNNYNVFLIIRKTFLLIFFSKKITSHSFPNKSAQLFILLDYGNNIAISLV